MFPPVGRTSGGNGTSQLQAIALVLPMLSKRSIFEFEIDKDCKPNITSENDVGGIGVLIGFTSTALITLFCVIARYTLGLKYEQYKNREQIMALSREQDIRKESSKKTVYKQWARTLNRVLLNLSDIQNTTALSAVIAVYLKYDTLHAYHQLIAYQLPGFAQAANFAALIYLRGSFPERDIVLREVLIIAYGVLFALHSVYLYPKANRPEDCIRDWRPRFRVESWMSELAKYVYYGIIVFIYVYLMTRRRPKCVYWVSKVVGYFKPLMRFVSWLNLRSARSTSSIFRFLQFAFPQHTLILVLVIIHIGAISVDIWLGLFMANKDLFLTELTGKVQLETDYSWGFGQVLSVAIAMGFPLQLYQAWSDQKEWQKALKLSHEPDLRVRKEKRTRSSLQRMYEKYNLVPEDDGYESDLNWESDVPLYKVIMAVNKPRESKNSEGEAPATPLDEFDMKDEFRVHVRPQSTFEEFLGSRPRYARPSFQAHRLRRHVARHSLG
ncbi:hypothetical protein BJ508DRAFT_365225 [Ascobolus immersus RN42]|uniref:Uncharacterized protein n=1 Tax=Ascobolus immersus RN42 TaxID=1160509 RepID=A0A3N4HQK3_ASCIM|nr:hypothetical protein BJ508DRAFT_365225 [Ascobolus immersus RN42]